MRRPLSTNSIDPALLDAIIAAVRDGVRQELAAGPNTLNGGPQPQLMRLQDAMKVLAVSRSGIYRLFGSGDLTPVKRGRSTLIARAEIEAHVARLRNPNGGVPTGPFARCAESLRALGLAIIPCDAASKRPLVGGFTKWRASPAAVTVANWARKFPAANLGIACGLSGVVVVDIDDVTMIDAAILHFGPTPLRVRTPSGGAHLYYRNATGQRSRNLRSSHGAAIDLKAVGGFVFVPPSVGADGVRYEFESGDFTLLDSVPPFDPAALARPFP
jgi:hypothetical protein